MKRVIPILTLLFVWGCVTPMEYEKGEELSSKGQYIEALNQYELALKKTESKTDRNKIIEAISKTKTIIVDSLLSEATQHYQQTSPPTIQSIESTISLLNRGLRYDDALGRLSNRIDALTKDKGVLSKEVLNLIQQADDFVGKRQYFQALMPLREADKKDPVNELLRTKTNDVLKYIKKYRAQYLHEIEALLSKGEGEKAKGIFDKLLLVAPDYSGLETLKDKIHETCRAQLLREVSALEARKNYFKAYHVLTDSEYEGLKRKIVQIREAGKRYYYIRAKDHLASKEIHLAYINSVKARVLAPKDIRIFEIHKKSEDVVRKEVQKQIAILAFDGPANDPDAGKLFSGAIISRLFKTLPYGINIVEREKIDMLMNEKEMKLQNIGSLLGVDMIITGSVPLFKADKTTAEGMASAKIKIGEEEKPNPEFTQMLKVYGKDLKSWPHVPSMTCKEDKYEIVKYKKGKATLKAFGNISLRIFDAKKAAIVYARDFKDSVEKSDEFQESIASANIKEDPLEIPTVTEIKGELRDKVVGDIVDVILGIFQNREKRFLQWATLHINRKEYHEAIRYIAQGYFYSNKSKTDNEWTGKIFKLMIDLTEAS
ncbi:MAG: hypothetical protein SV686_12210 [Thermodesulfobacteriota bacterium]|nr:hypothetical protein [Thermodesulfobacteriota bacterium]